MFTPLSFCDRILSIVMESEAFSAEASVGDRKQIADLAFSQEESALADLRKLLTSTKIQNYEEKKLTCCESHYTTEWSNASEKRDRLTVAFNILHSRTEQGETLSYCPNGVRTNKAVHHILRDTR